MINNIKKLYNKYRDRCRNFHFNTIAGLFTGAIIGIFFNLITNSTFNRWINPFNLGELMAAIIYFSITIFLVWISYFIGKLFIWLFISKQKKHLINFKINYFAGIYSAIWVASLLILKDKLKLMFYLSVIFILLYLPIEYLVVKNPNKLKQPKTL